MKFLNNLKPLFFVLLFSSFFSNSSYAQAITQDCQLTEGYCHLKSLYQDFHKVELSDRAFSAKLETNEEHYATWKTLRDHYTKHSPSTNLNHLNAMIENFEMKLSVD